MATHARRAGPWPGNPALLTPRRRILLFLWMIVPLAMTIYFSLLRYNLLDPGNGASSGCSTYDTS